MFQVPTFALGNGFLSRSVSRFGHPRLKCLRTANRGFSQLITSFVASQRQGIHRLLLLACSPHLHPNVARTCSREPQRTFGWLLAFRSAVSRRVLLSPCAAPGPPEVSPLAAAAQSAFALSTLQDRFSKCPKVRVGPRVSFGCR